MLDELPAYRDYVFNYSPKSSNSNRLLLQEKHLLEIMRGEKMVADG
jgi:hypothetical protein